MKSLMLAFAAAGAAFVQSSPALAQENHTLLTADAVQWGNGPASLPPGAKAAVLYGDPAREGLFVLRLHLPDGYKIPAHMHPKPEIVTVISGTFHLGTGPEGATTALTAGSFFAFPPGMVHHARAEGETVVQLSSTGPWAITYVNPADDPRRK